MQTKICRVGMSLNLFLYNQRRIHLSCLKVNTIPVILSPCRQATFGKIKTWNVYFYANVQVTGLLDSSYAV